MRYFSESDGYRTQDLLHFGYGHADAARLLFKSHPSFLDSAGYLAHLGVEVIFAFGKFPDTHRLGILLLDLKQADPGLSFGQETAAYIEELDRFYLLRYSPGPTRPWVEIGQDDLEKYVNLLDALWKRLPTPLVEQYMALNRSKKGNRVLMCRHEQKTENSARG